MADAVDSHRGGEARVGPSRTSRAVENQMCSEMRETLTARLLSCKLAMSIPDVPGPAVEKIRAIDNLASDLRTPLELN
jgi:hypothetical protein